MSPFRPIPTCSAEDVRHLTEAATVSGYLLLDVRQPVEYEHEHLPGAELVPLADLPGRLDQVPRDRTVVVYCRTGQRSAAATALLRDAGHPHAVNLDGGILAYQGVVATGRPELSGPRVDPDWSVAEQAAVAWQLERATGELYAGEARRWASETSTALLLERLAESEEAHQRLLEGLAPELDPAAGAPSWPDRVCAVEPPMIEGGIPLDRACEWARTASDRELFELAAGFETLAFDRYVVLARRAADPDARSVYRALADAEREHLRWLTEAISGLL